MHVAAKERSFNRDHHTVLVYFITFGQERCPLKERLDCISK